MLTPWLLLAAPVAAAALWWGTWVWVVVAAAIAAVQYLAFRRTERFSARVWRTVGMGRRSRQARTADTVYIAAVIAGIAVLVAALYQRFL